ncbi:MAG: hypothetical protein CR990_00610 [Desulfococcus sp.]|nr:MAG: hypothetical protein CR990_00610 [Desulfococcus sp.]
MAEFQIRYEFQMTDGHREVFDLRLDEAHSNLVSPAPAVFPEWSRLACHQCSHCPLDAALEPFCPVALNLADLVSRFNLLTSYDGMKVVVSTRERTYIKKTSAQQAISSLMGLLIAASRCPMTFFFKPLAKFHLPFATTEDTIWRATSTYMLSQYFLKQQGYTVDFELRRLNRIYSDIQKLNQALADRLRSVCEKDSTVNAVGILDIFAQSLPLVIEDSLDDIRPIFHPLLHYFQNSE